jgi:hypothetical protein
MWMAQWNPRRRGGIGVFPHFKNLSLLYNMLRERTDCRATSKQHIGSTIAPPSPALRVKIAPDAP